ncbi:hypothetical protein BDP27DRAFT_1330150 [Rhodocollybia butyracea]|uniref:Uncharacterized protein n=1 Tax=Rhodocollybia butyracea TaxID=206335 RepID=A0A9P5U6C3_9AGAR|nr:hypothetical protein BDP27DRAFT_1330150 [Rhodocollybia butyracea]
MPNSEQIILGEVGSKWIAVVQVVEILIPIYGAFLLGTCIAIKPLISSYSKPKLGLLVCLILVFICFTWSIMNITASNYGEHITVLASCSPSGCALDKWQSHILATLYIFQSIPGTLNLLLSDLIVVWRAWILFPRNWVVKAALAVLLASNMGNWVINTLDCIADILSTGIIPVTLEHNTFPFVINQFGMAVNRLVDLDWISIVQSLAVNVVATVHRGLLKQAAVYRRTYILKILFLLIIYIVILFNTTATGHYGFVDSSDNINLPTTNFKTPITSKSLYVPPDFGVYMMILATAIYPISVVILIHNTHSPVRETLHYLETGTDHLP